MKRPLATYRLQLRNGVDFDAAQRFLPHLNRLGIDHLYLSPIFTATEGSTHGYDVTRPDEIDPALGGEAGFGALSDAARNAGIGIILDLVPNHTAFSLENPWLRDVLRHGPDSRFAPHFDIDWAQGKLVLPWLPTTFATALSDGAVSIMGDEMRVGDIAVPLRADAQTDDLAGVHAAQHWQLTHWTRERDGITHRRFFNITDLIGMRVEAPAVFDDMHALLARLVAEDRVQGVRIDHSDGLADPATYLDRLRAVMGERPIWVEKVLTGEETLPGWPVEGTTGYETGAWIARALGDAGGVAQLTQAWRERTGIRGSFHDAVADAKRQVLRRDLASELHTLVDLAGQVTADLDEVEPGPETLREALVELLVAFPRYRSYVTETRSPDAAFWDEVRDKVAEGLRSAEVVDLLVAKMQAPDTSDALALIVRFQQVSGALLAKSHEDTAGFRWTPYLATCEVGADPDKPTCTIDELAEWAGRQDGWSLTLTSSHDTKRSEDARMRLVAFSHHAADFIGLFDAVAALPEAAEVPPQTAWYATQSALAIWDAAEPTLATRLGDHMTKAIREADEITSWTHPDETVETAVGGLVDALINAWRDALPAGAAQIIATGERLSLEQLLLKLTVPGTPDIYQGCEDISLTLTDPDNRRPVTPGGPEDAKLLPIKSRIIQSIMGHRLEARPCFEAGTVTISRGTNGHLSVTRALPDRRIRIFLTDDGLVRVHPAPNDG